MTRSRYSYAIKQHLRCTYHFGSDTDCGGGTIVFRSEVLRGFSFALFVGISIGTYSSIFIAAPVVIDFDKKKLGTSAAVIS